jgi:hypothetical protein
MGEDDGDGDGLAAARLGASFERWTVTVPVGTERPTSAEEWTDAIVVVEGGAIEVVCRGGACRTFGTGSYLCLSWLPIELLRNPGHADTTLAAYRHARGDGELVGVPYPA